MKTKPWPKEFLESEEEFTALLEEEWKNIKQHGLDQGILVKDKNGYLIGQGDPNNLFDSYEKSSIDNP